MTLKLPQEGAGVQRRPLEVSSYSMFSQLILNVVDPSVAISKLLTRAKHQGRIEYGYEQVIVIRRYLHCVEVWGHGSWTASVFV